MAGDPKNKFLFHAASLGGSRFETTSRAFQGLPNLVSQLQTQFCLGSRIRICGALLFKSFRTYAPSLVSLFIYRYFISFKIYIPFNGRTAVNDEMVRMWKETLEAYFEILSQNLAGGTEEYHVSQEITGLWIGNRPRDLQDTKSKWLTNYTTAELSNFPHISTLFYIYIYIYIYVFTKFGSLRVSLYIESTYTNICVRSYFLK